MRYLALSTFAVAAFAAGIPGAAAASRPALCTLIVDGKTYINGRCDFEADADGSFRIFGKRYFAYVDVEGDSAHATWNKDPKATHAHSDLGTFARKGACWENARARICALDLRAGRGR